MTHPLPPALPQDVTDPPRRKNILGRIGLILAIVGAVFAVLGPLAFFAWLFTLPGVILGIIGLTRRGQRKGTSLAAVITSSVAFVVAIIVSLVFAAGLPPAGDSPPEIDTSATQAPEQSETSATPSAEPSEPEATPRPTPKPFAELTDQEFAVLARNPDARQGDRIVIYGQIIQFDANTGACAFLADVEAGQRAASFEYLQRALVTATDGTDCPSLNTIALGDHIRAEVTVIGSSTYPTQDGGNATVPSFEIGRIEVLPALTS